MVVAGKVDSSLTLEPNPDPRVSVVELELRSKNNPVLPAGGKLARPVGRLRLEPAIPGATPFWC